GGCFRLIGQQGCCVVLKIGLRRGPVCSADPVEDLVREFLVYIEIPEPDWQRFMRLLPGVVESGAVLSSQIPEELAGLPAGIPVAVAFECAQRGSQVRDCISQTVLLGSPAAPSQQEVADAARAKGNGAKDVTEEFLCLIGSPRLAEETGQVVQGRGQAGEVGGGAGLGELA